MKGLGLAVLLVSILGGGISTISRVNKYSMSAAQAYERGYYQEAIVAYEYLINDLEAEDEQIRLNLAHAYYKSGRLMEAQQHYRLLADNPASYLRSIVHLQLGNIATKQKKFKQALSLYKQALVAYPENEEARYNFELLKKFLDLHPDKAEKLEQDIDEPEPADTTSLPQPQTEEQEPQSKKEPDTNGEQEEEIEQPQPDQNGKEGRAGTTPEANNQKPQQSEKEQATGDKKGDTEGLNPESQFDPQQKEHSQTDENVTDTDLKAQMHRDRLRKANISPERAKLLLDAMRNAELQYIQQLPKKATSKPDRTKPDW